ncbi:MAG: hypothetical protein HY223_05160 [Thaumarchaeota archaeon]|nr:hypothetical protein [Nitrososphaerota archaeon]MBI3639687.1 hypothetical protein [Nitrososphaerota archaeon]
MRDRSEYERLRKVDGISKNNKDVYSSQKSEMLDDIIFPSLANLMYFFNKLEKDPNLRKVFHKDVIELVGMKRTENIYEQLRVTESISSTKFIQNNFLRLLSDILSSCVLMKDYLAYSEKLNRKTRVEFGSFLQEDVKPRTDKGTQELLADRLDELNKNLNKKSREEISDAAGGKTISQIVKKIRDGIDTDNQIKYAKEKFQTDNPSEEQITEAANECVLEACKIFDSAKLRKTILDVNKRNKKIKTRLTWEDKYEDSVKNRLLYQIQETISALAIQDSLERLGPSHPITKSIMNDFSRPSGWFGMSVNNTITHNEYARQITLPDKNEKIVMKNRRYYWS